MQVVAGMDPRTPLGRVGACAELAESLGFDALHVPETVNDSLVVAALALEHTQALTVRTSVTVAFARSPMQVALSAWSLAELSGGRFDLGLGSQIRQNVEDRYGMTWSSPVARMADYVGAVRAAWAAFRQGNGIDFVSDTYSLRRLQPEFRPDPLDCREPDLWLGAVNVGMTRLAGAVADGLVTHPTNSHPLYLDQVTRPALAAGALHAERSGPTLIAGATVITAATSDLLAAQVTARRDRLAFLWSTPAYEPTLRRLGYGDLGERLRVQIRAERWDQLADLVTAELVDELCVVATYEELPAAVSQTFGERVDGILLRPPDGPSAQFAELVAALRVGD